MYVCAAKQGKLYEKCLQSSLKESFYQNGRNLKLKNFNLILHVFRMIFALLFDYHYRYLHNFPFFSGVSWSNTTF